jgi:hypothetical protein
MTLAGGSVLAIALVLALAGRENAQAVPGQIDLVAIDLNTAGNGPTAIGTIEGCRDDLATNATFDLDIVIDDNDDGINGISFNLLFDPAVLRIDARSGPTPILFMQDTPVGTYFELGDTPPITDGDFRHEAVELGGPGTFETGPGVMARFTATVVGPGVSTLILDDLIQQDGQPNIIGSDSSPIPIVQFSQAEILNDGSSCPSPTPSPTPIPTPTPVPSEAATDTPIPTPSPSGSPTPTLTARPSSTTCNTELASAAAAGSTTITVENATGCTAGDTIRIGSGSSQEDVKIASVSGSTITLVAVLANSHSAGETVVEVSSGGTGGGTTGPTPQSGPATGGGSGDGPRTVLLVVMTLAGILLLSVAGTSLYMARARREE